MLIVDVQLMYGNFHIPASSSVSSFLQLAPDEELTLRKARQLQDKNKRAQQR